LIGWVKFQKGNYEGAVESYRYLIEAFPNSDYIPRTHYGIADAFYNAGQYDMAREKYQYVIDTYPASELAPEALRGIQQSLMLVGREDEAIEVINKYTTDNQSSPFVRDFKERKATILFSNGRYKDAIDEYEALIETEGTTEENAEAMYWIGVSYINMGEPQEAEEAFSRLRNKFPESQWAAKGALDNAILWKKQANVPKSDSLFANVIRDYPGEIVAAQAGFERAILQYGIRDTVEALRMFAFVADSFPNNEYGVNARYKLGMFARKQEKNDEARMHFAALVQNEVDPGFAAEASYRIGELLMMDEFYGEAIDAFEKTKTEFSAYEDWFAKALLDQGLAYQKLERYNEALEVYKALRELRTDDDFGMTADTRIKNIEELMGGDQ
jgi:TolA-binding protein